MLNWAKNDAAFFRIFLATDVTISILLLSKLFYYSFICWKFFTPVLTGVFFFCFVLLKSDWQHVSSDLWDSPQYSSWFQLFYGLDLQFPQSFFWSHHLQLISLSSTCSTVFLLSAKIKVFVYLSFLFSLCFTGTEGVRMLLLVLTLDR